MKLIRWALCSAAVLLSVPQPGWAITPATNSGIRNVPTSTSETIERGGMITDINPEKKTIAVDGVIYPLAPSIKIYSADVDASRHNLKKSMLIRFTTVKDIIGRQEKIIAIWITNPGNRPPRK